MRKKHLNLIISVIMVFSLTGCGGGSAPQDLKEYVEKTIQSIKIRTKKTQIAALVPPIPFVYMAEPLRAPFDKKALSQGMNRVAGFPLQSYPLSVLKFIGTITEGTETYAYITAPDQITYKVKSGDKMGDHDGIVTSVQSGRVDVTEMMIDTDTNTPTQHVTTLELKEAQ